MQKLRHVLTSLKAVPARGGLQGRLSHEPPCQAHDQIILQQQKTVCTPVDLRLLLTKPEQLTQRQCAAEVRYAGLFIKSFWGNDSGDLFRLLACAAVKPDHSVTQRVALRIDRDHRFTLCGNADSGDLLQRGFRFQMCHRAAHRVPVVLTVHLDPTAVRNQIVLFNALCEHFELRVDQAGFDGGRAVIKGQIVIHVEPPFPVC